MLTDDWYWLWWTLLSVLVVANVVLLTWTTPAVPRPTVSASGAGSVVAGGSIRGTTTTRVRGPNTAAPLGVSDVEARGSGSVAAGGDIDGDTSTDVG
ncbi:hypothetical protein [Saccharothrix sp. Mg75]|uniref:hypothetical protein n=1 Tax=Saccharothrix sp. Mg75 TaxID=3445357 RepID=UPI003EEF407A